MKVYIVLGGDEYEPSIEAVFLDKDVADEFAAQTSCWQVKEHEVEDAKLWPYAKGMRGYHITMDKAGKSQVQVGAPAFNDRLANGPTGASVLTQTEPCWVWKLYMNGSYSFLVNTDQGQEAALRIADERRLEMIKTGKWPKAGQYYEP